MITNNGSLAVVLCLSSALLVAGNPTKLLGKHSKTGQPVSQAAVYVQEVSSSGGIIASSDTQLETIKTLREKGVRVVTDKDQADFILMVTRRLGKQVWRKDTKIVLSNRQGEVVLAKSARSIGGIADQVAQYLKKRSE